MKTFFGHRWIPLKKSSDVELCCFSDLRMDKRDAGDLRRHRAYYDVIVVLCENKPGRIYNMQVFDSNYEALNDISRESTGPIESHKVIRPVL